MSNMLYTYDTTFRDGRQSEDFGPTLPQIVEGILALDRFGIDFIEAGWPFSNDLDRQIFVRDYQLQHANLVAFGMTAKKDIPTAQDKNLLEIVKANAPAAAIFGKTWRFHIYDQLRMSDQENLQTIEQSVRFLKENGKEVFFDAEHFFDGSKEHLGYSLQCLESAVKGGAKHIVLCDTNGSTEQLEVLLRLQEAKRHLRSIGFKGGIGVHFHNDRGIAVGNSIITASELIGSDSITPGNIQGTINGYGERAGNADLICVIPNLYLSKIRTNAHNYLKNLRELGDFFYEIAGQEPNDRQPFTGRYAFGHTGGVHLNAILKAGTSAYEFMCPEEVGNYRRIALSQMSGKANIILVLRQLGYDVDEKDSRIEQMLHRVKKLDEGGFRIGFAVAEQYLLAKKFFENANLHFKFGDPFVVDDGKTNYCRLEVALNGDSFPVESKVENGPVHAIYTAMQKAVMPKYPSVESVNLTKFMAKNLDKGTGARVRVCLDFEYINGGHRHVWTNIGVSRDINKASAQAIGKALQYHILRHEYKAA